MSGIKKALLDTNVIIFASKQLLDFEKLLLEYDAFYVSLITYMEVYGFAFDDTEEKALVDELFQILEIIEINTSLADKVITNRKEGLRKIKLPDAIILASAQAIQADLISDDWDDFVGFDTDVTIRKIDDWRV